MLATGRTVRKGILAELAVLYVEDDEAIREQLAAYLRRRVRRLYTAENGRSGLEAFRRFRPDIVVSDIRMPVMDGLAMAEEIKRDVDDAAVILTSAYSDPDYVLRAIDLGVDKYVLKPVKVDELVCALQRSADVLAARRELRLTATAFQVIPESVLITDANRVLIAVNPAFEKITGFRQPDILGREIGLLDPGTARGALWRVLAQAGVGKGDVEVLRKDGTAFSGWLTVDMVRRDGDVSAYVVFVLSDLSERKAAEAALKRVNEELEARVRERTVALEEANRELESFSYSVSHDLSAPLRHIDGFASVLQEHLENRFDTEALKQVQRIKRCTATMGHLIHDLLALSRMARVEMSRRDCSLSEIADQVADSLRQAEPGRIVDWVIARGLTARADPRLMRIVFQNLLGNAWKFTSKRDIARIEVAGDKRNGHSTFCVRDNGAGFDMKRAGKLFAPFERLHRQDEFEGTGIGLAIVERILRRHGGRIWAESEPGQGAAFFFTLG